MNYDYQIYGIVFNFIVLIFILFIIFFSFKFFITYLRRLIRDHLLREYGIFHQCDMKVVTERVKRFREVPFVELMYVTLDIAAKTQLQQVHFDTTKHDSALHLPYVICGKNKDLFIQSHSDSEKIIYS